MLLSVYPNGELRFTCGIQGAPRVSDRRSHRKDLTETRCLKRADGTPLSLVHCAQLSQTRNRKRSGLGPITKKARASIRHLGGVFQDTDRHRQVFVTGTLPGSTDSALAEFGRLSGYVIKLIQTYVPRALGLRAASVAYLWVWEHQKRGALHVHACFELPSSESAKALVDIWRGLWNQILNAAALKTRAGVDLFGRKFGGSWSGKEHKWRSDAQICKKSVSRYLSKYQSKGSSGSSVFRPSRWYGASRSLRVSCRSRTLERSWNDHTCPKDKASVIEIRRSVRALLEPLLSWGELVSTRGDREWRVDLMGFVGPSFDSSALLGIVRESCKEYLKMTSSDYKGLDSTKDWQWIKRLYLQAFQSVPPKFRGEVLLNLPPYLRELDDLRDMTLSEFLDFKATVSERLYSWGYVGDSSRNPAWVSPLQRLVVGEINPVLE